MMDAFYDSGSGKSAVGEEKVNIYFPGKTMGTFSASDGVTFQVIDSDGGQWYGGDSFSEFSVVVTAYGAVGEKIEGTFSGMVISDDNESVTASVTEGKFSVKRSGDN